MATTIGLGDDTRADFADLQNRARREGRPIDSDSVLRWLIARSAVLDQQTEGEPA